MSIEIETKRCYRADRLLALGVVFAVFTFILLGLAGCSALLEKDAKGKDAAASASLEASRRLFAVSFQALSEFYVEPVDLTALVLAGLKRFLAADSTLSLEEKGEEIQLIQERRAILQLEKPVESEGWAKAAISVIDRSRRSSSLLGGLLADEIYSVFFSGVVSQLDGVSRYEEPWRVRRNRAHREGFGGIGVQLDPRDPRTIYAVLPESPAARAGLLGGDILLSVDGRSTRDMSHQAIGDALRGPLGSQLLITLERIGEDAPLTRSIARKWIVDRTISWQRDAGDIGYIRISDFTLFTSDQLKNALNDVMKQGRPLRGLVIDVRDNPGGFLFQGTKSADIFLDSGLLLTSRGRNLEANQRFMATAGDLLHGLPLIVLVNGYSASAAELMAASLQDNGRAVIVGSSTYGKGTIQKITPLENGAELILTFAYFHAPSGYRLQNRGVLPNICTSAAGGNADEAIAMWRLAQIDSARLSVPQPLTRHRMSEGTALARNKTVCPPFTGKRSIDLELDIAHRLLANPALFQRALRGAEMRNFHRD